MGCCCCKDGTDPIQASTSSALLQPLLQDEEQQQSQSGLADQTAAVPAIDADMLKGGCTPPVQTAVESEPPDADHLDEFVVVE